VYCPQAESPTWPSSTPPTSTLKSAPDPAHGSWPHYATSRSACCALRRDHYRRRPALAAHPGLGACPAGPTPSCPQSTLRSARSVQARSFISLTPASPAALQSCCPPAHRGPHAPADTSTALKLERTPLHVHEPPPTLPITLWRLRSQDFALRMRRGLHSECAPVPSNGAAGDA
jgi:hypothetical protein